MEQAFLGGLTMIEELFCQIDEFCKEFCLQWQKQLIEGKERKRHRTGNLSLSEIVTILKTFQTSNYRTFKHYYLYLLEFHRSEFPGLVSYSRFIP